VRVIDLIGHLHGLGFDFISYDRGLKGPNGPSAIGWGKKPKATLRQLRAAWGPKGDGCNFGIRLGGWSKIGDRFLVGLDVDIRDPDKKAEAHGWLDEYKPEWRTQPSIISGAGGENRHLYTTFKESPWKTRTNLAKGDGWSIDVRGAMEGKGAQNVWPGSTHPDTGEEYTFEREFDVARIADALEFADQVECHVDTGLEANDAFEAMCFAKMGEKRAQVERDPDDLMGGPLGLSIEDIRDTLDGLDVPYWTLRDTWLKAGMALHHEFEGHYDGLDLWSEYSIAVAGADTDEDEAERVKDWKSFADGNTANPVSFRTLIGAARDIRLKNAVDDDEFDDLDPLEAEAEAELSDIPGEEKRRGLSKKHALVMVGGKAFISTEQPDGKIDFGGVRDFHYLYHNKRAPAPTKTDKDRTIAISEKWMLNPNRRTYTNGYTFAPGGCDKDTLNLWRGWAVKPDPDASCQLFLDHMLNVIAGGNKDHFDYIIGWLAHLVQKTVEKPGVSLVLRSGKGAGKDTVAEYIINMIGSRHAPSVSQSEHIVGKFNSHLGNALLLNVQEGSWAGNHAAESVLKYNVTSKDMMIEKKGLDTITVRSALRIFISANADWVVPASKDERRWAVFEVSDNWIGNRPYFDALHDEKDGQGPAALLYYLQNYNLTGFNVRAAPQTEGLRNQKIASLQDIDGWWYARLCEGEADWVDSMGSWADKAQYVNRDDLRRDYETWLRSRRYAGNPLDPRKFGKRMLKLLPWLKTEQKRLEGGVVRRYVIPPLEVCRKDFEGFIGAPCEWDEDEDYDEDDEDDNQGEDE
jgi:hypothetical protein